MCQYVVSDWYGPLLALDPDFKPCFQGLQKQTEVIKTQITEKNMDIPQCQVADQHTQSESEQIKIQFHIDKIIQHFDLLLECHQHQ